MIKLSVVITCYNKGQFLKRCLDSCVKQNSQEVEFIIVDDGSTDNSKEIYNKYKDVRFHAYYKENGGVSSARNFGIEKSQGKYITFLDADDEYPENAVITMIRYSNEEPIYEFNHKRQWGNYTPLLKKTIPAGCYELRDHKTCFWAVWNKTFRRDFLNENKLRFDTNCNYGEDEVFIIECLAKCRYYKHIWAINLIRHFDDKSQSIEHVEILLKCSRIKMSFIS